ncbi:MAG: tetratricopeptide repeat protein [Deltaproteobacteria bacterium]|nr:tetratricopeptide repeat protein [Deltaproteobacteria bacterium]
MADKPGRTPPSLIGSLQGEVATEASPLLQFLTDHAKFIVLGVVLFLFAIGGYWLYDARQTRVRDDLRLEFGRLVTSRQGQERLAALEQYLQTAPAALHGAALFAMAETAREIGDPAREYAAWERIAGLDPSMRLTAALAMAEALTAQEKRREALDLLESTVPGLSSRDSAAVNERIAFLAESLGDFHRAIVACEAAMAGESGNSDFWMRKIAILRQKTLKPPATPE